MNKRLAIEGLLVWKLTRKRKITPALLRAHDRPKDAVYQTRASLRSLVLEIVGGCSGWMLEFLIYTIHSPEAHRHQEDFICVPLEYYRQTMLPHDQKRHVHGHH